MMLYAKRMRRAGFTLIEIMIVIAIIAILAGIMVPNFVQARAEAQLEVCLDNCEAIIKAVSTALTRKSDTELLQELEPYVIDIGSEVYGRRVNDKRNGVSTYLVENGYLGKLLFCPVSGAGYCVDAEFDHSVGGGIDFCHTALNWYTCDNWKDYLICHANKYSWCCWCYADGHLGGICPCYSIELGRCCA